MRKAPPTYRTERSYPKLYALVAQRLETTPEPLPVLTRRHVTTLHHRLRRPLLVQPEPVRRRLGLKTHI
jgi:hypothetical protein